MTKRTTRLACALMVGLWLTEAAATTIEIGPGDDLRAAVNGLQPGDILELRSGTYTLTFRFSIGVQGTAAQPITIRAKAGATPHLTRDPSQNVINIEGARHLIVDGLEVSAGSHGIRLTNSSYITIQNCHVHSTGDVGISANVPGSTYEGLAFLGNHVHHTGGTGEGFYLGCNNAGCTMFASTIADNYVHDTNIGTSQGDGIEIKHGSYDNRVTGNLIHDTGYPCIIAYGTAGNPRNVIEKNTMWGCGDHGIQVAADAVVRNNVVLEVAADGIHSQIHQGAVPGNLTIVHNTVVVQGDGLRISDIAGPVIVANNALYSARGNALRLAGALTEVTSAGNIGTGTTIGVGGGFDPSGDRVRDFVDVGARDLHLPAGSSLIAAGDPLWVEVDDHDGTLRAGIADVGAFAAGGCRAPQLGRLPDLTAVKGVFPTVALAFGGDPVASEYHVNSVTDKRDLAGSGAHRPPIGMATPECTDPGPACIDPDALLAAPRLYYRAVAACGPGGEFEGPPD